MRCAAYTLSDDGWQQCYNEVREGEVYCHLHVRIASQLESSADQEVHDYSSLLDKLYLVNRDVQRLTLKLAKIRSEIDLGGRNLRDRILKVLEEK